MVALRCPCHQGPEVWGELWWTGGEHRWMFFDDDKRSETYAEQVERCPACGSRLERKEMAKVSAAQVALSWLLGRPGVASIIVGARTDEQLADNLKAAELRLSDEECRRLDEVSAPPLLYPYWHQAKTASDRLGSADLPLLGPHLDDWS